MPSEDIKDEERSELVVDDAQNDQEDEKLLGIAYPIAAIIGSGSIILIALLVAVLCYWCHKKKNLNVGMKINDRGEDE